MVDNDDNDDDGHLLKTLDWSRSPDRCTGESPKGLNPTQRTTYS